MKSRFFLPGDASAVAVGADQVAETLARASGGNFAIVRTGSRGMAWLEPLLEIEEGGVRLGFGPLMAGDIAGLVAAGLLERPSEVVHPKALGPIEELEWMRGQSRLTFARSGIVDPASIADYRALGGFQGLLKAQAMEPAEVVDLVVRSGLRGRGGAGFPAGIKWGAVLGAPAGQKYVVCNADEGDSGTFADRMLMEGDPFSLIEGMLIAGHATGAAKGFIYLRSEYPHAARALEVAIDVARSAGYLGPKVAGSNQSFEIELRMGAGAYVCGEETSLLESLEGKRGQVRAKPPLPAHSGLFGRPTLINNVLTLAAVPPILVDGAQNYAGFGIGKSLGTMPIQLGGNIKYPGLYETGFGITLGELVNDIGGGTASGRPVKAVQVGGPLGAYFPPALFDTLFDYEAFTARGGLIGHGGVVVFDDSVDLSEQARFAFEFCAIESCGKCTPCRIGAQRGRETMDEIIAGRDVEKNLGLVAELCETMQFGSLCALGGLTPYPVKSAIRHFPDDFRRAALKKEPA